MKKKLRIPKFITLLTLASLFWGAQKIDWHPQTISSCPYCSPETFKRQVVYEGSHASAIITYKPAVPGHLLIIPNRHVERFDLLNPIEIAEMSDLIKRVHKMYCQKLHTTEYLLLQKNGRSAGQSVPHAHMHIFPRTSDVGIISFIIRLFITPILKPLDETEMETYIKKVSIG